ncbi:pseudouridine synthase [Pelagibius sp. Alg239-R121]|uniref:pseudouridine synthase n=1 Tax=Pelagibius sp. Alg239-R121 TaxID=2993448 RepID=UPI0024A77C2E|nr:pseudouridine synthase [Pelagibius sp. Alg239-R121]
MPDDRSGKTARKKVAPRQALSGKPARKKNTHVQANKPVTEGTYKAPKKQTAAMRAKPAHTPTEKENASKGERIAKIIARAGLCSRRDAERWIAEGRVQLDGKTLETAAVVVTPGQSIVVDGQPLPAAEQARVWRFHKSKGVITTRKDPEGRPTVFDGLPKDLPRLEPVGRLDYNSEGLLLFTNDGELKRRLELPSTGWSRRYRVRVHGKVDPAQMKALEKGITVEGVNYGPIQARLEHQAASNAWIAMTLREGKNREIRRICEHLGLVVNRLIRVSYGPFPLGDLEPGKIEAIPARILRDQLGLTGADADDASKLPEKRPSGRKPSRSKAGISAKTGKEKSTVPSRRKTASALASARPRKGATDLTDITVKKPKRAGGKNLTSKPGKASTPHSRPAKAAAKKTAPGRAAAPSVSPKRGGKNANRRRTS